MAFKPGQLEQWDPMYVYCPEEVLEAGAPYNLEELIERLEQGDRTLLSRLFDVRYPYWKRNLRRNVRLVADLRYLGEVVQSELWRKVMGSSPSWIGLPSLLATAVLDH